MIYSTKRSFFCNAKYSFVEWLKKYKILIIISLIILLIGVLTGILTAIKLNNLDADIELSDFSMYSIIDSSIYKFSHIFIRLISVVIFSLLLLLCSIKPFLIPFGLFVLAYRAYLLALNCVFIIINIGFGGYLFLFLIIIPCQLLILSLLVLFYCYLLDIFAEKKKFGCCQKGKVKSIWWFFAIFIIICLLESLLLFIFRPTTMFII